MLRIFLLLPFCSLARGCKVLVSFVCCWGRGQTYCLASFPRSFLVVPLSPVWPPRKPIQFANQPENYFLFFFSFFFLCLLLIPMSWLNLFLSRWEYDSQCKPAARPCDSEPGEDGWAEVETNSTFFQQETWVRMAQPWRFLTSLSCRCRLAPCPCSLLPHLARLRNCFPSSWRSSH